MAAVHIISNRAKLLNAFEAHGWVSFGAGASVAYVFIHVFPEIGIFQQQIAGHAGHNQPVSFINQPLYLAALGGLCLIYFLDTIEERANRQGADSLREHEYHMPLFYLRTFLYTMYNIMIAYIITQRPGEGLINITLITFGLMLHFIVVNVSAYEKYGELFEKYMRWSSAVGLMAGWVLGLKIDLPEVITITIFSVIGGMITYIALKRELPQTGHRAPLHFLAGAVIYSLIILGIPYFGLSHQLH